MGENFYNTWRPIQLKDIVGQETVVKSLTKEAEQDKFSHAYLFAGSFGSGKTSIARILATILTCATRKPNTPMSCGRCRSCIGIHNGQCADVLELDGASNRGIDDIRHIKESVYYAPQELSKKVIIIDECHKLTSEAFTALLKIIEEPPPYVHFILCTTDYRKVPKPIISRCQRFNFVKIPSKLMAERLAKVAEREKIKLSDGVALAISRVADGSLRDGLGFLEQIAASSSGEVTMEAAMHFFGMAERRVIYEMAGMILDRNISGVLYKVNELIVASVDIKTILIDISEVFRNVFLAKTVGTDTHLLDLNKDELDLIASWAAKLSTGSLLRIASSFSKIEKEITFNINERWILEAALVNCILILNAEEKVSDSSAVANR